MWQLDEINKFMKMLNIETRPKSGPGLWLMFLLPLSLIYSVVKHPVLSTATYKLSSIFSFGLICTNLLILYYGSRKQKLKVISFLFISTTLITSILYYICLHRGVFFSLWSGIFSTIFYYRLYIFLLRKLPRCFTLGEASICTQAFTIFIYFTLNHIEESFKQTPASFMKISTLIIQVGLGSIALLIYLCYQLEIKKPQTFYITTITVLINFLFLPLHFLLKQSPLMWIFQVIIDDFTTSKVFPYWFFCTILAVVAINRQIQGAEKASTSVRKIFHVLAVFVYIPGLLYNCSSLYLASGVILGIFFAIELLRILKIPPLSDYLNNGLLVFADDKDSGIIALTPIYLLAGCSIPLWIHPAPCDVTNSARFTLLPLLSGILTIGIGDTAASIIGSKMGKHYWFASTKTVEGTIACILSQCLAIFILIYLNFLKFTLREYLMTGGAIVITSLIEAKTDQVDNLVLPLVMYLFLI